MAILGVLLEKKKRGIQPKNILLVLQILVVFGVAAVAFGIYMVIARYQNLQTKTDSLRFLQVYNDAKKGTNQAQFLKDISGSGKTTVEDVQKLFLTMQTQLTSMSTYYDSIQKPYVDFFQYLLLPPLNIWQDKYTGKINDELIGKRFLQDNSYLDVNLVSQWTDFFKNIGQNSPMNTIKSITVGAIAEKEGSTFTMPVNVSFISQTKRSLLLLVDKLSMTSNRENISLINEFLFNMWLVLHDKNVTNSLASDGSGSTTGTGDIDKDIGQQFYGRVNNPTSNYIQSGDIDLAIRRTASCEGNEDVATCSFKFREKMRTIPALAYTVGLERSNKVKELRNFLKTLPPLINVKSFTFQKQAPNDGQGYEGSLSIEVYGTAMTSEDVSKIAAYLGSKCTNNTPLNPEVAIGQLDVTINQASSVADISNEKSTQLTNLRNTFLKISDAYKGLSGFKKVIKLFEIYRMLQENRLCVNK